MNTLREKLKAFARDVILPRLLSDRLVEPYLFIWARLVLQCRKPFIIGVTGSVGKTTTTKMIASVLGHRDGVAIVGRVGTTSGRNDVPGLSLSVLRVDALDDWLPKRLIALCSLPLRAMRLAATAHYPKVLVLEYGTDGAGQLDRLTKLARPDIAVVTTIAPAHLQAFKTIEGVVKEKSTLVRVTPASGLVIIGEDHGYVADLEREARAPVVKVTGRGIELSQNITRAVCTYLHVPEEVMTTALKTFEGPKSRLNRLVLPKFTVIDDSYNANPTSMKLGLDTLMQTAKPGQRRVAILGFMAELGEHARAYHEEIGAYARSRADMLVAVGDLATHYDADHWFDDSAACAEEISQLLRSGDCVFVKGSYAVRMSIIVTRLKDVAKEDLAADQPGCVETSGLTVPGATLRRTNALSTELQRIRLLAIYRELGIPRGYFRRGLPYHEEAEELVAAAGGPAQEPMLMAPRTRAQWSAMRTAAAEAGVSLSITSAFRSFDEQADLIRDELSRGSSIKQILKWIAAPGYSEHHTGRALDIAPSDLAFTAETFEATLAFQWLRQHAARFEFEMSYPRDNAYGLLYEPWHWRCRPDQGEERGTIPSSPPA
jgi:UDP-N-acetylmuramyl pentapeptide synthase